jgi:hypothetical protein
MGLLFALPAWILWDGRTATAFIVFVLLTSKLPDLDLVLQGLGLPVKHHGVLHTVVFVVGFSVVAGAVAVAVLRPVLRRWWRLTEDETVRNGTIYLFVTGGLVLGGLSHLFADMLAADPYEPIEPLWPLVQEPFPIHVLHYTSLWLNLGLFILATALHAVVIVSGAFPVEHQFRRWKRALSHGDSDQRRS